MFGYVVMTNTNDITTAKAAINKAPATACPKTDDANPSKQVSFF